MAIELAPHVEDKIEVRSVNMDRKAITFYARVRFVSGYDPERKAWRVQTNAALEDNGDVREVYIKKLGGYYWTLVPDE